MMKRRAAIAYTCAVVHAIATVVMASFLAPGLTGANAGAYIAAHRLAWTSSWLVWQCAALTLVALYATFSRPAAIIGALGASIDITSEWQYILHGPSRTLEFAIGVFANGFYSIGLLLLLVRRRDLPLSMRRIGWFVVLAGFAMCAGSAFSIQWIEIASTAALFPAFVIWAILAARCDV